MKQQKRVFFLSLITIFATTAIWAQCPTGDVIFNSQADVDDFIIDYPTCTEISGDLSIGGSSDITDLSPLENLTSVTGSLFIVGNATLTTSEELNIEQIGGDLQIVSNSLLEDVDGFSNIESIGGTLQIIINTELDNVSGLSNLEEIGENFQITSNDILTNLDGFSSLTTIEGEFQITANPLLIDIDGLSNLETINGEIVIASNPVITSIYGLANVDPSGIEDLILTGNDDLGICVMTNLCTYLSDSSNSRTISGNTGDCIDSITIESNCETLCEIPTAVAEEDITETTAMFSWEEPSETFNLEGYNWAVFEAGANPETDDPIDEGDVASGTTSIEISDLTPGEDYEFYVQSICDDDATSDWTTPESFTTENLSVASQNLENLNYYPNPVQNRLNIKANQQINQVSIYDINGKLVLSHTPTMQDIQLNTSNLQSGVYFMKVNIKNKHKVFKLIKE